MMDEGQKQAMRDVFDDPDYVVVVCRPDEADTIRVVSDIPIWESVLCPPGSILMYKGTRDGMNSLLQFMQSEIDFNREHAGDEK